MEVTIKVAGIEAKLVDTDEEFNTIHQALELVIGALKAVGYSDVVIAKGILNLKNGDNE